MGDEAMKYYQSCDELPIYNFIKVVITGDHTWLVQSNQANEVPDAEYLAILFNRITKEYNQSSGDITASHAFNLYKDINILNDKMALVQMTVDMLARKYDSGLCDVLRSMGFLYDYDPHNLHLDLKMTIADCKVSLDELKEYEKDYQAIIEVNESNKPTEKEYAKILAKLSKYMGFRIDPKSATVLEFLEYMSLAKVE